MNIYGIGTDIVNVNRIKSAIKKNNQAFKKRVYTNFEIRTCERRKNEAECFNTIINCTTNKNYINKLQELRQYSVQIETALQEYEKNIMKIEEEISNETLCN